MSLLERSSSSALAVPRLRRPAAWRDFVDTFLFLLAAFVLLELAAPRFMVDGPSMQPTFYSGQRLITNRLSYLFGSPQQGDIVVFHSPGSDPQDPPLIKRLIGLPGDTIETRDTQVYVNGERLEEPYVFDPCTPQRCADSIWVLGPEQYFLMGDNRNRSNDSRFFGPVPHQLIIGQALIRYWPIADWALVDHIGFVRP